MKFMGIGLATIAIGWMGLIFYLSSLSALEVSQPLEINTASWLGTWRSYVGHIVLYAVLAALVQGAFCGWNRGANLRWVIIVAIFSTLFGISDEYHQSFVSGRSATVVDALVDFISATVSATLLWLLLTAVPSCERR